MFFNRLKSDLCLSDRYKLFASDWLWIEVCQNAVFSKKRYHYDNSKQKTLKSINSEFFRDLDLLLKIRYQELKVWCLANNLREK